MYNNYSAHFTSSYIIASAHLRIISKFPTPPSCHSDMVVTITSISDFQGTLSAWFCCHNRKPKMAYLRR